MAVVLELVNRSGHVLERRIINQNEVTIGRAYDNDFIVNDPHVDPHHLRIVVEEESFHCEDLQTLNGTEWENITGTKHSLTSAQPLASGASLFLGKSSIRVKSTAHPVSLAVPLSVWEWLGHFLTRWWMLSLLVLAVLGLATVDEYLNRPQAEKYREHILSSLYILFGVVVYSGVWALIGRNLKHDGRFFVHVSLSLSFLLLLLFFSLLEPMVLFNTSITRQQSFLGPILVPSLTFLVILASLHYATHLNRWSSLLVAMIIPAGIVLSITVGKIKAPEFYGRPQYDTVLVSEFWQWRNSVTMDSFIKEAQKVYGQEL